MTDSKTDSKTEWKEWTFSSGVTVLYGPFPHGMYFDIMGNILEDEDNQDPEAPKKEIKVLGGTEEVDDTEDPEYKAKLGAARTRRFNLLAEAALELAVRIPGWPEEQAAFVDRLINKYGARLEGKTPETDADRRLLYLYKHAIRTKDDWKIVGAIQRFSQIENEEIRLRAESFRGDVAGSEGDGTDAPGVAEE